MEGTSGAVDLGALRGAAGEAALGPGGRVAQAARSPNRAERCCVVRASGSCREPFRFAGPSCESGWDAAGGLRKQGARGSTSLELARAKGSCDGIVRVGGSASVEPAAHGIGFQPVSRRFRDARCPGGSGWGEALVSGRHLGNVADDRNALRESHRRKADDGGAAGKAGGAVSALPAGP
jgi:hypothetical protein